MKPIRTLLANACALEDEAPDSGRPIAKWDNFRKDASTARANANGHFLRTRNAVLLAKQGADERWVRAAPDRWSGAVATRSSEQSQRKAGRLSLG